MTAAPAAQRRAAWPSPPEPRSKRSSVLTLIACPRDEGVSSLTFPAARGRPSGGHSRPADGNLDHLWRNQRFRAAVNNSVLRGELSPQFFERRRHSRGCQQIVVPAAGLARSL